MDRREFMETTSLGLAALGVITVSANAQSTVKAGICDWNLLDEKGHGGTCRPELIPRAKEANLNGIQVSIGSDPSSIPLRDKTIRQKYIDLGKQHSIEFCSVAAGGICNSIPLKSEPQSAVYVIDALETAKVLGAKCTLIAFFGNGELRLTDAKGQMRNISKEKFKEWELDTQAITRVVETMKQIAPRAEDLGVIIGLENTLSAKQNMEILERIGSPMVQIYYDLANSTTYGYDVPSELRLLGKDRICEIHLKDNGKDVTWFGELKGDIDWQAISQAVKEIQYNKWFVIEESGREGRFMEDTRASVAFAQKTFA